MLNDLETIKQAVIQAVPEIVGDTRGFDLGVMHYGGTPKTIGKVTERDITLEDVLRAIGSIEEPGKGEPFKINSPYGDTVLLDYREKDGFYHHAYWHLGKPLHDQSEEFLAFLAGVFKK